MKDDGELPGELPTVPITLPTAPTTTTKNTIAPKPTVRVYVASKNSTKYHLPSCGGAKRISEENKIWFSSKSKVDAEATGRTPASNCPGV